MTNEERVPVLKVGESPDEETQKASGEEIYRYVGETDGTPPVPGEELVLMENKALVRIPENTIQLELVATVWQDGKPVRVSHTLDTKQVRQAFEDGKDYIDDYDTFSLTSLGLQELEAGRR